MFASESSDSSLEKAPEEETKQQEQPIDEK